MNKRVILIAILLGFIFAVMAFAKPAGGGQIACLEVQPPGDHASYSEGLHQIFNGDLLFGRDDVYTTDYGYLQCYCSPEGNGIQTTWVKDEEGIEWGEPWNLGDFYYNPVNTEYFCGEIIPESTPTPAPNPTPQPHVPEPFSPTSAEVCIGEPVTIAPVITLQDVSRVNPTTVKVNWVANDPHQQSFTVHFGLVGQPLNTNKPGIDKNDRSTLLERLISNTPIDLKVCAIGACGDEICSDIVDP